MQDMIAKGVDWLESQRKQHLAVMVGYRRQGALFVQPVAATIGGTRWDSMDAAGQVIRFETRDYFVSVDDLADPPRRGDVIVETVNGVERTYEVMIPGGANNPWSWADRAQRVRRIHTQLIETF
jgi:hypothetical protein